MKRKGNTFILNQTVFGRGSISFHGCHDIKVYTGGAGDEQPETDADEEDCDDGEMSCQAVVPVKPLVATLPDRNDEIIARLQSLMQGCVRPKDVLRPVRAAIDAGAIRRMTWGEFCSLFGNVVRTKSSYSEHTNPDRNPYDKDASFERMKAMFE